MKKAFSLVELLTITAVICIMAAILSPVMFSAKQQSVDAQAVNRMKQLGMATLVYASDHDDLLPLAAVLKPNFGNLGTDVIYPFPASSTTLGVFGTAWNNPARRNMASCFWANAVFSYVHNAAIYALPGAPSRVIAADNPALGPDYDIGATMNGDLHRYPIHSVVNPNVVPLFWTGEGKVNIKGRASVQPFLDCGGNREDCIFNPTGRPSPISTFGSADMGFGDGMAMFAVASYWITNNKEMPVARVDGSAKSVPVGNVIYPSHAPASTAFQFPFASLDHEGGPGDHPFEPHGSKVSYWTCNTSGVVPAPSNTNVTYWCFFRPDRAH